MHVNPYQYLYNMEVGEYESEAVFLQLCTPCHLGVLVPGQGSIGIRGLHYVTQHVVHAGLAQLPYAVLVSQEKDRQN